MREISAIITNYIDNNDKRKSMDGFPGIRKSAGMNLFRRKGALCQWRSVLNSHDEILASNPLP